MRSVGVVLAAVMLATAVAGCRSKRVIAEMRSDSVAVRVVHTERIDTVVARLPAEGVAGLMPAGCRESVVETSVAVVLKGPFHFTEGKISESLLSPS